MASLRHGETIVPIFIDRGASILVTPFCLSLRLGRSGAVLEAPTFITGFNDVAVVGEPVEQGRDHFGVAKTGPAHRSGLLPVVVRRRG